MLRFHKTENSICLVVSEMETILKTQYYVIKQPKTLLYPYETCLQIEVLSVKFIFLKTHT